MSRQLRVVWSWLVGGLCLVCLVGPAWAEEAKDAKDAQALLKKVSFYGFLRLDAILSDSRLNHNQYSMWVDSEDPRKQAKADQGFIDLHPRLTRFGLKVDEAVEGRKLFGNMEIDFQNRATSETAGKESESRQIPRLRHGYLKLTQDAFSLLAGQTSDLISPLWPSANGDAGFWNSGNLGDRRPQIRLIGLFGPVEIAAAGGRTGAVDIKDQDGDNRRDGDESGRPMLQGRVGLSSFFDKHLDLGLWGHSGSERLRLKTVGGQDRFVSESLGADLKIKITERLSVAGEVWAGRNLSDVRGGIGQGVNTTTGNEITAQGGWAELILKPLDRLTLAAGGASDDPDNDDLKSGDRRRNTAVYGSSKFDLTKSAAVGLEYIHWRTNYVSFSEGDAERVNLYFTYSF